MLAPSRTRLWPEPSGRSCARPATTTPTQMMTAPFTWRRSSCARSRALPAFLRSWRIFIPSPTSIASGVMHLPVEVAEKLAHAYASAEPEMVLMYIEDEEKEYKARGI